MHLLFPFHLLFVVVVATALSLRTLGKCLRRLTPARTPRVPAEAPEAVNEPSTSRAARRPPGAQGPHGR